MSPDVRPRDLAVLLIATGGDPPRQRARDQQADRAGLDLRREILNRLVAMDPEADDLGMALAGIVDDLGEPTGPSRAIALSIVQDWESSRIGPGFWSWLVAEAVSIANDTPRRRRRPDHHVD